MAKIKNFIISFCRKIVTKITPSLPFTPSEENFEKSMLLNGRIAAMMIRDAEHINDAEFSVFSQCGEDGIIQWLVQRIPGIPATFVEFGVENYFESNTRFLMQSDNWQGLVIDGNTNNISQIKSAYYFWKHDLSAVAEFITMENINSIISSRFTGDIGLLSIDIDGNDYWIWECLDCIKPYIVICEYNGIFGSEAKVSVPYEADFQRTNKHYSNLYFGASLAALVELGDKKGYKFVGCNKAGNDAFFVRKDVGISIPELQIPDFYNEYRYRQARDLTGNLLFLDKAAELNIISGLKVFDFSSNSLKTIGEII